MAYYGYFRYDGIELINNARLDRYARNLGIGFWNCRDQCETLEQTLEQREWKEGPYTTPAQDMAPWYDPVYPPSAGFAGIHILEATNIHSSTHTGGVSERARDGGTLLRTRRTSREMLYRVLLVGVSEQACHYGLNWLTTVLTEGNVCAGGGRFTNTYSDILRDLEFYKRDGTTDPLPDNYYQLPLVFGEPHTYAGAFDSLPQLSPILPLPEDEFDLLFPNSQNGWRLDLLPICPDEVVDDSPWRNMVNVGCTSGPAVISEHTIGRNCEGGAWMEVEFILVAGSPSVWHDDLPLSLFSDGNDYRFITYDSPWVRYKDADTAVDDDLYNAPSFLNRSETYSGLHWTIYQRASEQQAAAVLGEGPTQQDSHDNILDPNCPPPPSFPSFAGQDLVCSELDDSNYNVTTFQATNENIPRYLPVALSMKFTTRDQAIQNAHITVLGQTGTFQGRTSLDFWITYLPPFSSLIIDSKRRYIYIISTVEGSFELSARPASHLITLDEEGTLFDYPETTCPNEFTVLVRTDPAYDERALQTTFYVTARDT